MSDDPVWEYQQRIYLQQCKQAYRDWIETNAMFEAYNHAKRRQGYAINFHAIKKSREMQEMDEVEGNSNRFDGEKSSA